MSDTNKLAERIAKLLESEKQPGDLASVFATLENINHRLDKLESSYSAPVYPLNISHSLHPSQEKFAVIEAVSDQIVGTIKKEKACTFEPNGRPCDHCSMCSSRGF